MSLTPSLPPRDASRAVRRIVADVTLVAGGGCAILLQLADARVARGVAVHSDFDRRPFDRLVRTLQYVYGIILGDSATRTAVSAAVRAAHAPVHGSAQEDAPAYDADDAETQLWVAATLFATTRSLLRLLDGPRWEDLEAELYAAYGELGTALRVPPSLWPPDLRAFDEYWSARTSGPHALRPSADATRVARTLLGARAAPCWLRMAMPWGRLMTAGLLPAPLRSAYGLAWTPRQARRFRRVVGVLRLLRRVVPGRVRRLPALLLLRRAGAPHGRYGRPGVRERAGVGVRERAGVDGRP